MVRLPLAVELGDVVAEPSAISSSASSTDG
jgi:hypothetical protein